MATRQITSVNRTDKTVSSFSEAIRAPQSMEEDPEVVSIGKPPIYESDNAIITSRMRFDKNKCG